MITIMNRKCQEYNGLNRSTLIFAYKDSVLYSFSWSGFGFVFPKSPSQNDIFLGSKQNRDHDGKYWEHKIPLDVCIIEMKQHDGAEGQSEHSQQRE